ncbi:SDR family NAD(P)-dependent oxidoreductase [Mesorhizobium sp. M0013]|uniref:SDR family NAD(P)-dependent oxidoreductase n=1 Tax=Mesorhizobium sp. M0013 TaxID=2956841 RepID=UPI00333A1257
MYDFNGKIALVTGGARNIGLATVKAFLEGNARVVLVDRDQKAAGDAADELGVSQDRLRAFAADISDETSVKDLMLCVDEAFGNLDIIVNNAGICTLNLALDLSVDEWDRVQGVNLRGPWLCAKHGVPLMKAGGAIVNIASQAAQRAQKFTAHYSASKMGIIGLTRALSVELAPKIRVNAVSPGTIQTDMIQNEIDWRISNGFDDDADTVMSGWMDRIPMQRFQKAEHIARAILFLASDEASETTGETLNVSGGAVMV